MNGAYSHANSVLESARAAQISACAAYIRKLTLCANPPLYNIIRAGAARTPLLKSNLKLHSQPEKINSVFTLDFSA